MQPRKAARYHQSQQTKTAEKTLRVGEDRYRSFFEHALAGFFHTTREGRFVAVNPALVRMLGYEAAGEVLALRIPEDLYVDPTQWEALRAAYEVAGVVQGVELLWKKKSGEYIVVNLYARVLRDPQGWVLGYEGVVVDITERKRSEDPLRQSEERYHSLAVATAQIVWTTDPQGHVTGDLPLWRAFTGQSVEEIQGKGWLNALHPADHPRMLDTWAHAVATRSAYTTVYRMRRYDGEYRYFGVRGAPVLDKDGQIREWIGTCSDITERKRLEEQLRQSEERYRIVSEITSDYAYAFRVNPDGTLVLEWITAAFTAISGFSSEEIQTQDGWGRLVFPEDMPILREHWARLLAGQPDTSEFRILTKTGEMRWLRNYGRPVWDEAQSRVVRLYGAGQDISERKRLEELVRERVLRPKDLAANLRKFRQQLGLTQVAFGRAFGGYSQRQITSYETGEIEIPLGLLLSIRSSGYPLEVVLGSSQTNDALNEVISYLSTSRRAHDAARQLAENLLRILEGEGTMVTTLMSRLGIPVREDSAGENRTPPDVSQGVNEEAPLAVFQSPPRRGRPPRED
jgi:PAS domain S-box-containing protein